MTAQRRAIGRNSPRWALLHPLKFLSLTGAGATPVLLVRADGLHTKSVPLSDGSAPLVDRLTPSSIRTIPSLVLLVGLADVGPKRPTRLPPCHSHLPPLSALRSTAVTRRKFRTRQSAPLRSLSQMPLTKGRAGVGYPSSQQRSIP